MNVSLRPFFWFSRLRLYGLAAGYKRLAYWANHRKSHNLWGQFNHPSQGGH